MERLGLDIKRGSRASPERLSPVIDAMVEGLEQAAGLRPRTSLLELFTTHKTAELTKPVPCVSFSGGVADCIYGEQPDWLAFGDVGVLLGRAIRNSQAFQTVQVVRSVETIRATVVGAGSHSTEISGSTIFYRSVKFPLKNLPILKLTEAEEQGSAQALAAAITDKLRWFADEGGLARIALGLRGEKNPSYRRVTELAEGIRQGLEPLLQRGFYPIIAVETDMAKVLGQALAPMVQGPLLCLDGVGVDNGDYIDIGAPVASGNVLPIVIKTLVFNKE